MIQEPLNIVVSVPSGPHWLADFATSLIGMLGHFSNHRASLSGVQQYRVVNVKGSILPRQRLNALQAAKQVNASHLFFVDSDHTFPPDMLNRLLKWDKDCVAANCVTKSIPAIAAILIVPYNLVVEKFHPSVALLNRFTGCSTRP